MTVRTLRSCVFRMISTDPSLGLKNWLMNFPRRRRRSNDLVRNTAARHGRDNAKRPHERPHQHRPEPALTNCNFGARLALADRFDVVLADAMNRSVPAPAFDCAAGRLTYPPPKF